MHYVNAVQNDEDVNTVMHRWFHAQVQIFFLDGIRDLLKDRSSKCVK
jgi:hypothetical protein